MQKKTLVFWKETVSNGFTMKTWLMGTNQGLQVLMRLACFSVMVCNHIACVWDLKMVATDASMSCQPSNLTIICSFVQSCGLGMSQDACVIER